MMEKFGRHGRRSTAVCTATLVTVLAGLTFVSGAQARSDEFTCSDIPSTSRCVRSDTPGNYESWSYAYSVISGNTGPVEQICAGGIKPNGAIKVSSQCYSQSQRGYADVFFEAPGAVCRNYGRWQDGPGAVRVYAYATQL